MHQVPNYYKIISNPMDLGTVRSRLSKTHFNHYQSVEEFVADLQLIFTNCDTFNPVSCVNACTAFLEGRSLGEIRGMLCSASSVSGRRYPLSRCREFLVGITALARCGLLLQME